MTSDEERLRTLELIVAAGAPFPEAEFAKLSTSSQIALESRVREELEQLACDLGPEAIDPLIAHLSGLLAELRLGCAPGAMIGDMEQTIERLKRRRADYN